MGEAFIDGAGRKVTISNLAFYGASGGVASVDIETVNTSNEVVYVPISTDFQLEVRGESGGITTSPRLTSYNAKDAKPGESYSGTMVFDVVSNVGSDDVAVIWNSDRETVPDRVRWGPEF